MIKNLYTIISLTFILFLLLSCQKEITQREPTGFNYAWVLDGSSTFMTVPRIAHYQLPKFTVEALVRFDEVHDGLLPIIAATNRDLWKKADGFAVIFERRRIVLSLAKTPREAFSFSQPIPIQANKWYHIACSFDGRIARIYIDGTLHLEQENELPVYYGDAGFSIGHATHSYFGGEVFFKGQMDEVRIWNYVRSPSQVLDYSRHTLRGDESGLVGYWNFDDRDNSLEPALDYSILRNHGQISGKLKFVQSTAF